MESLLQTHADKVKSIGISNFTIPLLEKLLPHCKVVPATNQIEIHP
jgi:glycerol 2-dehydrogenase (NADP+)